MKKTREQLYQKVMEDAMSKMLTELEEVGFDTENIVITIELFNGECEEEVRLESK